MRRLDARIWKPIFKKALNQNPASVARKGWNPQSENGIRRDGRDAGIGTRNWIIRNPGIWLFFWRKRSGSCPWRLFDLAVGPLMFCASSPELTPTFVCALFPSPPPALCNPGLSLVHSYICLLLTVLLGRIHHHLLTYLSQNLSFDQLVFYNLHLFYI